MKANKIINDIDGLIVLNKPKDMTSNDCLSLIKRTLHPRKLGHTGTLDKNATGVLVCLLGNATKCQEYLMKSKDKIYEAELIIGMATDTEDITGNILEYKEIDSFDKSNLENVIKGFIGEYKQTPPMYSAKKVGGKKLLDLARKGIEVDRKECKVVINDLKIYGCEEYIYNDKKFIKANLYIDCSKGTYIRTLCKDIGLRIGNPSCMGNLNRLANGEFSIKDSITLDGIKEKVANNDLSFIKPCYYNEYDTALTFGKFETLHLGHQEIINKLVTLAKDASLKSTVMIIDNGNDSKILTKEQRISKLKYLGVDKICSFKLDENNKKISAYNFVKDILYTQLKTKIIVVGSDCRFGYKGEGDTVLLKKLGDEFGIKVYVIDKLKVDNSDIDISSTLIKKEYDNGNIDLVNKLMGK